RRPRPGDRQEHHSGTRRDPHPGAATRWRAPRHRRATDSAVGRHKWPDGDGMTIQRMDNVGIVVDDLPAAIAFFRELGLELEGQAVVEGEWAGRVTGLGDQRVEVAMMRTP